MYRTLKKGFLLTVFILIFALFSYTQNAHSQPGSVTFGSGAGQFNTTLVNAGNIVGTVIDGPFGGVGTSTNGVIINPVVFSAGPNPPTEPAPHSALGGFYFTDFFSAGGIGGENNLQLMGMTASSAANSNCTETLAIQIFFDPPVENLTFTLVDIDSGNALSPPSFWHDLVVVQANGGTVFPDSAVTGGANVVPIAAGAIPAGTCSLPGGAICPGANACHEGVGNTTGNSTASNVTYTFNSTAISELTIAYTAADIGNATVGAMFIGLGPMSWTDTLPVTLSSFNSSYGEGGVVVDWSTSTETINIGFNIYAHIDGERVIINDQMIESHMGDSVEPQFYEKAVSVPEGATELSISSVDIYGHEEYFGPYEIGASYGKEPVAKKIEWKKIREQYNQKMAGNGFEIRAGKMRAGAPEEQGLVSSLIARVGVGDSPVCNVAVDTEGMYRLRQRDLRSAGCNFKGEDIDDIAVTFKGEPVSRRIHSNTGKIKGGTNIFFYADTPSGRDYLYTTENVYQVSIDPDLADIHEDVAKPKNNELSGLERSYMHEVNVDINNTYNFTTPYGEVDEFDPWSEQNMSAMANTTSTYSYEIPVLSDVDTTREGKIKTRLIAVTDFPDEAVDHKVILNLNSGADKGPFTQEGRANWYIETPVEGSDFAAGVSSLDMTIGGLPVFDFMRTDSYGLMYWRPTASIDDVLSFTEYEEAAGYSATGYSVKNVQVYGEKDGQLYKLKTKKRNEGGKYTVSFKSLGEGSRYWVSPTSQFNEGDVTKADAGDIKSGSADVLILTHPALTGAELDAYESYVSNEGYTTKVANVLNVYDGFGYGMPTPDAIRSYLEYAKDNLNVEYVAIVGGTTTEYPDPAVMESIQYVPTQFELTQEIINFTPCDGCMADFNEDFVPELKIFRIPSRQVSDTGAVATKSVNYDPEATALLLADRSQEQNFGAQLDAVSAKLGGYDQMKYYLSDIMAENSVNLADAVCIAQQGASCPACPSGEPCESMTGFIEQINDNNKRLIMYNGHSSVLGWTFNSLFTNIEAENLTNTEPTVVIPMACYTTYYEHPGTVSLADQLLFNQTGGSVAVSGAATLSSLGDNGVFAGSILDKMCDGQTTLAEAVYETKQENPALTNQVINWDLLGNGFVTIAECEEPVVEPPSDELSTNDEIE